MTKFNFYQFTLYQLGSSISMGNSKVTVLFGINCVNNGIEIARAKPRAISMALRVLLIPNSTGYPCFHSLIGQFFLKLFAV